MRYQNFSKKELTDILEIIHSSVVCKDEADIRALMEKLRDLVNGDYSICGVGKGGDAGLSEPPRVINGNYPEDWLKIYAESRLYLQDPIILHNFQYPGAQLWDETYRLYSGRISSDFIDKATGFGLCHGVSGGFYDGRTRMSTIVTCSGKGMRFGARQKHIMSIVSPHLHQALLRFYRENNAPRGQKISKRESEVIKWVMEGKTNWEIGVILNISERTVKFHVQNIERKLNAVSKAHAIAIALDQNLVS